MPDEQPLPRWLVTGANGFLGANLGWSLRDSAERIGGVRDPRTVNGPFDSWIPLSWGTSRSTLDISGVKPAVLVHAAALSSHEACERDPDLATAVNVTASADLARAAKAVGARFVFISTDAVFDGERGGYVESDEPNPTSVYGATKLAAERAVLDVDPTALIVRTNFFGWSPTGKRSILEFFVNSLRAGTQIRGFTDFVVTSLYAQDLAETIRDLVDLRHSGIVHVAASDAVSKYDFGVSVAQEFGLDASLITPATSDMQPPRGRNQSLDVSLVESLLGRALPTQAEGIRRAREEATLQMSLLEYGAS